MAMNIVVKFKEHLGQLSHIAAIVQVSFIQWQQLYFCKITKLRIVLAVQQCGCQME